MATVIAPDAFSVPAPRAELVRLRSRYLKRDRILGPAWIILNKLVSRVAFSQSIEVCDLISIPFVPATSAQRCLGYLVDQGLVRLDPGPGKRFRGVDLAPPIMAELKGLLASVDDADEMERATFSIFI